MSWACQPALNKLHRLIFYPKNQSNMGNQPKSRREFLSLFRRSNTEKVKMLTPDGQLVEVDKRVLEQALQKKKASNKDIYRWMENPSKKDDE